LSKGPKKITLSGGSLFSAWGHPDCYQADMSKFQSGLVESGSVVHALTYMGLKPILYGSVAD